jgi:hypothetical protein
VGKVCEGGGPVGWCWEKVVEDTTSFLVYVSVNHSYVVLLRHTGGAWHAIILRTSGFTRSFALGYRRNRSTFLMEI